MEELTRLQTSRRAYRSHVTRIFNKIEDTLKHEIDELAITYLRTAVTQLEKKLDQIVKMDQEICGLIEDANTLEDTIMDSEELQDTIAEKINELNKRIELLSQPSSKKSGDDHTVTIPETDNNSDTTSGDRRETVATETSIENIENVSTTNSVSVSSSTSHTPTYTVSAVSTTTTTTITNTSTAMSTVPLLTPTIFSTSTLSFQLVPSYSISAANPSVSYIHSLGPPPLIPRVTNPSQYGPLPITMDHPLLLPSLSTLNLSTSTSPSLARVPTIEPRANPSLTEVMPTTSSNVTGRTHSQPFTASRLPKLTLPTFSGNPLHWLTFWDSFQAAIHLNPNLSAVQKFNYLKAQVDGDAAKTIEGFPLSDQNYLHAVIILQDRFGQTHKLVAAHMQALLEVASPSNTLTSLRTFHDVINSHSRGLSSLGKSEDTYGDLLVPIILNKLPKETRQNLARDTTTPEMTFLQLMAAILKEIRILETSNSTSYKSYSTAAFVVGSKPPRTNKSQDKGPQTFSVPQQNPTTATPVSSYFTPASNRSSVCLLKTAIAPVISGGTRINANILFDEGAQKSFICSELASKLQLIPDTTTQVALSSFGANSPSLQTLEMTTIQIQTLNGDRIPVSVLIVPHIATPLQNSCTLELDTLPHLRGLKLANPVSDELEFSVSILIGADHYWSFVQDHIIRGDGPTAQQSRLGYLLSGPLPSPTIQLSTSALLQITTPADQQFNPQEMWSIEAAGTNPELDRDTFLHVYQSSHITQKPDGTYTAKFPWKEDKPHLPPNLDICTRRTKSLVTKLRRHPELLKLYHNIIKDQEQRGFIEQVDDTSNTSNVHYLSHHAAASLNDCLIVGPSFINDLCAILLRFQLHPFALSTDIEKAFLHVHLDQADRDFTRFLWPLQPENVDSKFQVYRFTSVPFGTASSPFMLNATINLHLRKFHSPISDDIQKNIYVDNIISSCATEDHLIEYYHHSRSILRKAGFNLRSWASNSAALRQVATNDQTIDCNTTTVKKVGYKMVFPVAY
ncbi:uncharacterized protein [Dysidea avara]|uniref:uncharacterized protein n=1 Tax=Dysidea avara TaxID=196820 RepID=UPI00332548A7